MNPLTTRVDGTVELCDLENIVNFPNLDMYLSMTGLKLVEEILSEHFDRNDFVTIYYNISKLLDRMYADCDGEFVFNSSFRVNADQKGELFNKFDLYPKKPSSHMYNTREYSNVGILIKFRLSEQAALSKIMDVETIVRKMLK